MFRKLLICLLFICLTFTNFSVYTFAQGDLGNVNYLAEIEKIKKEEFEYHLKEFRKLDSSQKKKYSSQFGYKTDDLNLFKKILHGSLDKAYIFFMDDNGNVYCKDGYYKTVEIHKSNEDSNNFIITNSQDPSSINGASTGAFIRQTTLEGHMGVELSLYFPRKVMEQLMLQTAKQRHIYITV